MNLQRTDQQQCAAVSVAIGTGIAAAQPDDGEGQPITGDALVQASQAALAFTGDGTVTATEVGDEESLYEVEVTLADGSQTDVQRSKLRGGRQQDRRARRRHRTRRPRQLRPGR